MRAMADTVWRRRTAAQGSRPAKIGATRSDARRARFLAALARPVARAAGATGSGCAAVVRPRGVEVELPLESRGTSDGVCNGVVPFGVVADGGQSQSDVLGTDDATGLGDVTRPEAVGRRLVDTDAAASRASGTMDGRDGLREGDGVGSRQGGLPVRLPRSCLSVSRWQLDFTTEDLVRRPPALTCSGDLLDARQA